SRSRGRDSTESWGICGSGELVWADTLCLGNEETSHSRGGDSTESRGIYGSGELGRVDTPCLGSQERSP
ncbi:unnamed protein product, partial [Ostreobium quekettii]